ncbi:MAG: ATP-grasp fold amidoligase family protein [Armatimonadota bacterium]
MSSASSPFVSTLRGWAYRCRVLLPYYLKQLIPASARFAHKYRHRLQRAPRFTAPRTFNEKIVWLRRHEYGDAFARYADKLAARDYVAERVGEELLTPLYGVYPTAREIDFDALPDRFVLKCTHESGFVILCADKARLDRRLARAQLDTRLRMDYSRENGERHYRAIPRRILAEAFLRDAAGAMPLQYNIYCFAGAPRFIMVFQGRRADLIRAHYTADWEPAPFYISRKIDDPLPPRPANLPRQLDIARALSAGFPFLRVDLYGVDDRLYFNELTLTPYAGITRFKPPEYDLYWGEQLILPGEGGRMKAEG